MKSEECGQGPRWTCGPHRNVGGKDMFEEVMREPAGAYLHEESGSILERIHVQEESRGVHDPRMVAQVPRQRAVVQAVHPYAQVMFLPYSSLSPKAEKLHGIVQIASASSLNETGTATQPCLGMMG